MTAGTQVTHAPASAAATRAGQPHEPAMRQASAAVETGSASAGSTTAACWTAGTTSAPVSRAARATAACHAVG